MEGPGRTTPEPEPVAEGSCESPVAVRRSSCKSIVGTAVVSGVGKSGGSVGIDGRVGRRHRDAFVQCRESDAAGSRPGQLGGVASPDQAAAAALEEDASPARLSCRHRPCAQPRPALRHVLARPGRSARRVAVELEPPAAARRRTRLPTDHRRPRERQHRPHPCQRRPVVPAQRCPQRPRCRRHRRAAQGCGGARGRFPRGSRACRTAWSFRAGAPGNARRRDGCACGCLRHWSAVSRACPIKPCRTRARSACSSRPMKPSTPRWFDCCAPAAACARRRSNFSAHSAVSRNSTWCAPARCGRRRRCRFRPTRASRAADAISPLPDAETASRPSLA